MFKVGQVWRNNAYGTLYVVCDVRFSSMAIVQAITGRDAGWRGNLGPATARKAFTLIGNNYQERAPEPVRPGTAFKRWLGEMTSGIPEQRGCRKEDC